MANEQRLKELGALAQIFAQFQEPQLAQARLAQQAEQGDVNAMLNVLGLMQQRTEAEQRAGEAAARNEVALRQLGLTERQVVGEETERPLRMRKGEEEILGSQAERELGPRKAATAERTVATAEEQNRIEREKLLASAQSGQQTRLIDALNLLVNSQTSPEGQALIGGGLQGQPGFEALGRTLGTQQEERRRKVEEARAPALRAPAQGRGAAPGAVQGGGRGLTLPQVSREIMGRSVIDLIPGLVNAVNPVAESALGVLGLETNFGRLPSWWEASRNLSLPELLTPPLTVEPELRRPQPLLQQRRNRDNQPLR